MDQACNWQILTCTEIRYFFLNLAGNAHQATKHNKQEAVASPERSDPGLAKVYDSAVFLANYENTLVLIRQNAEDTKGKGKLYADQKEDTKERSGQITKWPSPQEGYTKVNVDADFMEETGDARARIIVRDCRGIVLLVVPALEKKNPFEIVLVCESADGY
uniref:Uncharacterized protein n=1 Tax=Oryza brachyantha TaxID=4533 RepID=J3N9U1_ORYBR